MFRVVLYLCIFLTIVGAGEVGAQDITKPSPAENGTSSPGKVEVKNCVKVFVATNRPAYSVSYDYVFPGRTSVLVSGLGEVPSSGSFHYLTELEHLEFRDSSSGVLLKQVPLVETIIVASKPPLNVVPNENDFQLAFRSFTWESSASLLERANEALGEYFRYLPRQDRGVTFIVTTFAPLQLQGVPKGVLGQVALLLSFPYDPASGKYSFHIQSVVREGRSLSDDCRPTSDPRIIRAADSFVDELIAKMKTGGGGQP